MDRKPGTVPASVGSQGNRDALGDWTIKANLYRPPNKRRKNGESVSIERKTVLGVSKR